MLAFLSYSQYLDTVRTETVDQHINRPMRNQHGNAAYVGIFHELNVAHVDGVSKLNTFHRADYFGYPANVRIFGRHFGICRKTWKRLEDILEDVIWLRECLEDVVKYFKIRKF